MRLSKEDHIRFTLQIFTMKQGLILIILCLVGVLELAGALTEPQRENGKKY